MSAEYTPTTDQVREAFTEFLGWDVSLPEADARFDRWLAETISEARMEGFLRGFEMADKTRTNGDGNS